METLHYRCNDFPLAFSCCEGSTLMCWDRQSHAFVSCYVLSFQKWQPLVSWYCESTLKLKQEGGVADDDESPRSAAADTAAAASAAETALASMLRTSCTIIDMGSYLLSDRGSRPYNADDAALPPIAGEHVRQILPEALVDRAGLFPPFDPSRQVRLRLQVMLGPHKQKVAASFQAPPLLSARQAGGLRVLTVISACVLGRAQRPLASI